MKTQTTAELYSGFIVPEGTPLYTRLTLDTAADTLRTLKLAGAADPVIGILQTTGFADQGPGLEVATLRDTTSPGWAWQLVDVTAAIPAGAPLKAADNGLLAPAEAGDTAVAYLLDPIAAQTDNNGALPTDFPPVSQAEVKYVYPIAIPTP